MTTPRPDQAALCGLVQEVRDVGLPLVSVTQVDPAQPNRLSPITAVIDAASAPLAERGVPA